MNLVFRTKKMQRLCSSQRDMEKYWGRDLARKLQQRLMELHAADCLADISHLPPARLHALSGDRNGQFSVDLAHPYRLLFVPANRPLPTTPDGGVDRTAVDTIEIIEIEDTH